MPAETGANLNDLTLPKGLGPHWDELLDSWRGRRGTERLWAHDATLWTDSQGGENESRWLGWLGVVARSLADLDSLRTFAEEVSAAGFERILLLGMGGSSLASEVLARTFDRPRLQILDSTDPAQVRAVEQAGHLAKTLFFVSSKSGTTLEPDILRRYFFDRASRALGRPAGAHFVAVTDPGSDLERIANEDGYRKIFHGLASIGGRYSALSHFGMAPAAAAGIDCADFLARAGRMAAACKQPEPLDNPGILLGLYLGWMASQSRDKLTLIASRGLSSLGAWLEQLVAESTGKLGRAIIPVDLEKLAAPAVYGDDRVFVAIELGDEPLEHDRLEALAAAGHPVVKIRCHSAADLAQEFFRWQIATAAAGSVLNINPFNQPDVEASKIKTKELMSAYEAAGGLPPETPFFEQDGLQLFADALNVEQLREREPDSLEDYLQAHLSRIGPRDYFALLAYIEMNPQTAARLQSLRHRVRDATQAATCLGFGPRFLHSTGQAYKGGPNSGVFLQITCDDAADLDVPDKPYSFGLVKAAQARGDFDVLAERDRRALRVHLSGDLAAALTQLDEASVAALGKLAAQGS